MAEPSVPAQPVVAAAQPNQSKGLAITSLVFGILGFLTGFLGIGILLGLVAVILGVIALAKHSAGKGMAIAGLITGGLALLFGGIIFAISLSSYGAIQDKALQNLCDAQAREGVTLDARCSEL